MLDGKVIYSRGDMAAMTEKNNKMAEQKVEGKKADNNKPDLSLVPAAALLEEAAVWTFGKSKYSAFNWHNGISYNRIIAAIERHTQLLKAGLDTDYETKRHHAAAIRCGCAMLIQFSLEKRTSLDDRMVLDPVVQANIELMAKGEFVWDLLASEAPNE